MNSGNAETQLARASSLDLPFRSKEFLGSMNSLENGRYRLVRKTFNWLVSIKEERVCFNQTKN